MAENTSKSDKLIPDSQDAVIPEKAKPTSSSLRKQAGANTDSILEFLSKKENELGTPISNRSISLLRRECQKSQNTNKPIVEVWRSIYG